ncbi:Ima1 N-terminal domain-containing protein [Hypoxylon sp. FL1284]|nr:Ima1 N-terminal domain-containing protein [Hypoxylon sp. FL1284]
MAALRSRKYLSCFYCGKRSKLRFEGQKSFACSNCEATNWLDEHGDITDPPSAAEPVERSQVQFAIPRSSVAPSTPRSMTPNGPGAEESVFCDTCLRNQHMLTSSLAQFEWPEESNSAEHAARERRYWALRKDLEKRYPQMCANCEPKVESKLQEASYNAQTDHLRRMMDRTRLRRQEVKKRGILDVFDSAGKWCWDLGFALQFSWHIVVLSSLAVGQYTGSEADSWTMRALSRIQHLGFSQLPHTDDLIRWAIYLGMCSLPWNPQFKQTIRGFTAHYLGFKQWYTYQLLIILVRSAALSMAQYSSSQGLSAAAQLGAQLAIAFFMTYIYYASKRSIHTDTRPLFRSYPKVDGSKVSRVIPSSEPPKQADDLGSILDEIANLPTKPHLESPDSSPLASGFRPTASAGNRMLGSTYGRPQENRFSEPTFDSLRLSDPVTVEEPAPQPIHYDEEMDWSPSASQHRAFSSYNPYKVKNTNPRFSDTPIEPKSGPIWYKVPPAPTTPAQRLRNPPMRPIIRESPKEVKENFFQSGGKGPIDVRSTNQGDLSGIRFAEPKFFAPEEKDDPRDGLSRMFASSFSISPSPDDEDVRNSRRAATGSRFAVRNAAAEPQSHRVGRFVELLVLAGALYGWVVALGTTEQYGPTLALTSVLASLIVSIRLAADLQVDAQMREGKQPSIFALSWANLGLVQVMGCLILAWNIWSRSEPEVSCRTYGSAHFATVMIHQMWHTFI